MTSRVHAFKAIGWAVVVSACNGSSNGIDGPQTATAGTAATSSTATGGRSAVGPSSGGAPGGAGGATNAQGRVGGTGRAPITRSAGCGKAPPSATNARQGIDIGGTRREYIVVYPNPYNPNFAYRVLYEFHGSGGTADENIGFQWYGVQPLSANSFIFVAPQGLGDPSGWPNTGGRDVAFIRELVVTINETFCVDTSRAFVTGFSAGAGFTNTLGCQMGNVFRGIAPASGGGPRGSCVGKVAAIVIHGSADATVNVSRGMASRDYWLGVNHCGTTTIPMTPSPCVFYQGCDPGYPVAWCEHTQGHVILPALFGPAIWNFISQF